MQDRFFEQPILNSPYEYPARHWELEDGQPTQQIIEKRRRADFITPIPKPRKRKDKALQKQLLFDEGHWLSREDQIYDPMTHINSIRKLLNECRALPDSGCLR